MQFSDSIEQLRFEWKAECIRHKNEDGTFRCRFCKFRDSNCNLGGKRPCDLEVDEDKFVEYQETHDRWGEIPQSERKTW